jgi:hypothetical protein
LAHFFSLNFTTFSSRHSQKSLALNIALRSMPRL